MATTFGIAYSFGAFLLPISAELGAGRGATAGIFSLTTLALFGLGGLSGPAVDRFGPRRVLVVGAVSLGLGLLLTSRATSLWQAYLGHGVGVGLAVACAYVPLVAVVGGWFDRRRTVAVGVAVSGIGLGTLAGAPIAAALVERVGWRDAYLMLAAVGVAVAAGLRRCSCGPRRRRGRRGARAAAAAAAARRTYLPAVRRRAAAVGRAVRTVRAPAGVRAERRRRTGRGRRAGRGHRRGERRRAAGARGAWPAGPASCGPTRPASLLMAGELRPMAGRARRTPGSWCSPCCSASGTAASWRSGPPLVAEAFGVQGLGAVLGVLYTSAAIGSAVGPPVAGVLIGDGSGYRTAVAAALGAAVLAAALVMRVPARR